MKLVFCEASKTGKPIVDSESPQTHSEHVDSEHVDSEHVDSEHVDSESEKVYFDKSILFIILRVKIFLKYYPNEYYEN